MPHTIKIRWSDLGLPTTPGSYGYRGRTVRVRQQDIERAKGNPDAEFTAIQEDFLSKEDPYRLGQVEFPTET
jgi:hypothetical protein